MSTSTSMTPAAHAHGAADHEPHVLPLRTYFGTWGTLLVLTAITVAVSYADLGTANLLIALLVATIKATTVALFFMHLKFDHKFHSIIFSFSLIFLGIFIMFTMFDTETRGRTDAKQHDRTTNVQSATGSEEEDALKARLKEIYGAEATPAPPGTSAPASAPALTPPR
jgi:cytochrome c oxidase subunit IV